MATVSGISSTSSSIDTLAQQYQASLEGQSLTPLQNQQSALKSRLSALTDLRSKLQALYDSVNALTKSGTNSPFSVFGVSSTNTSIVTATSTSSAIAGTHTLQVSQLAKSDIALTNQVTSTDTDIAGTEGSGTKTFRITVNGVSKDISVVINDGDTNSTVMKSIATAINAAGAGVAANAVSDSQSTSRLVLTSRTSGSTNAITITDLTGSLMNTVGLGADVIGGRTASTATTGGFVYGDSSTLDAKFKLDGIDFVKQTNSIGDVLAGVTFELKGMQTQTDSAVTLAVTVDKDAVTKSVQNFIDKYNAVISYIASQSAVDAKAGTRGMFASDSTIRGLRFDLRSMATNQVSSIVTGNPSVLAQIGITTGSDGTISISDSTKFQAALAADPSQVASLFNSTSGISTRMQSRLKSFVTFGGFVDSAKKGINSQMTYLTTRINRTNDKIAKDVATYRDQFAKITALLQQQASQQQMLALFGYSTTTGG